MKTKLIQLVTLGAAPPIPSSYQLLSVIEQIWPVALLLLFPLLITYTVYRLKRKFLFLSPIVTTVVVFIISMCVFGKDEVDFANVNGWLEMLLTVLYNVILCTFFYFYDRKKR
jgi:hypothetical protein